MSDSTSRQDRSNVGGHQVGRDLTIINPRASQSPMAQLLLRFRQEKLNNTEFRQTLDSLQHYIDNIDGTEIAGLEGKLQSAHRESQINKAMRFKELFHKMLTANQFFRSAQEIFAHILGEMDQLYDCHIRPLIAAGASSEDIDVAVQALVLKPIQATLDENDLGIHMQELRGMLYFLTGNCHIRWD